MLLHHLRLALPRGSSVSGLRTALEQYQQDLHGDSTIQVVSDSTLGGAYEQYVLFLNARAAGATISPTIHPVAKEPMSIPDEKWCICCTKRVSALTADCCFKCKRFRCKGQSCDAEPDGDNRAVRTCGAVGGVGSELECAVRLLRLLGVWVNLVCT